MVVNGLNTILSGKVRPIFGNFGFCYATSEPRPKKPLLIKKIVYKNDGFIPGFCVPDVVPGFPVVRTGAPVVPLFEVGAIEVRMEDMVVLRSIETFIIVPVV